MKQDKDELIDEYMTKGMLQAKKCKFRNEIEINTRLIEQIIRGGAHDKVREDLLCKDDTLTLDKAMQIARTGNEALQQELKEFKAGSNTHIDHVSNILSDNKPKTAYRKTNNLLDKSHNDKITNYYVTCKYCSLKHTGTQCPAAQSECRFCHKIGHWAAVCRQKSKPLSAQYHNNTGHARKHDRGHDRTYDRGPDRTYDCSYDHKFDELKFNEIRTDSNNDLTADLHFTLIGQLATMTVKVDTGAEGNIIPLSTYLRMYPEHCTGPRPTPGHLKRSLTTLTVYNGESMKHYGTIDLDITLKDYTTRATFFVAETPGPIILGLPSTKQMKIITINQIKTQNINIEYVQGKNLPLPDTFSRQPLSENNEKLFDKQISYTRFSEPRLALIKKETKDEKQLQYVCTIIKNGWPTERRILPQNLREFWPYRDELTYENNMVIKGNQILIPKSLRSDILKDLHIPHLGIVKTNLLAKTCVYWPKMTKEIQDLTEECSECQTHQRRQSPIEFVNIKLPREPWDAVAADLFEFNKEQYLLVADIYTKFPILRKLRSTHSQSIIHALKEIFSEHCIPRHLHTDNGPQFSAAYFSKFSKSWEFHYNTSSPHYPQSNGFIERQIQTVKRILTKTDDP